MKKIGGSALFQSGTSAKKNAARPRLKEQPPAYRTFPVLVFEKPAQPSRYSE